MRWATIAGIATVFTAAPSWPKWRRRRPLPATDDGISVIPSGDARRALDWGAAHDPGRADAAADPALCGRLAIRSSAASREASLTGPGRRGLRVVYLVTSSGFGGAEMQVRSLARTFSQRGWDVGVVSMLPLEAPFMGLDDYGVWTATLGMRRRIPDPRALLQLRTLLRARQPHILHGHMVHANLMARLSRLLLPVLAAMLAIATLANPFSGPVYAIFLSTCGAVAAENARQRPRRPSAAASGVVSSKTVPERSRALVGIPQPDLTRVPSAPTSTGAGGLVQA